MRLDHIQPIGRNASSYEVTPHCLSEEAMKLIDEWMLWYQTGKLREDGALNAARGMLLSL